MKSTLLTAFIMLFAISISFAQAPEKMNYQGVARDNTGNILANTNISIRLTVHQGTFGGTTVYQETHALTTNAFGLFTAIIGNGSNVTGTVSSINWGIATYYLQVELDPAGGSSYTDMGSSQLLSVPYALNAKSAANVSGTLNYIPKFTSSSTIGNSSFLYENSAGVAVGNLTPLYRFQVDDGDANNNVKDIFSIFRSNTAGNGGDGIGSALVFKNEVSNGAYASSARISGIAPYATSPGATGALNFEVHTGTTLASGLYINSDRAVGIGTASPNNALHVNSSSSNAEIQLTTTSTGTSATDGMRLGIGSASVYLLNSENKDFSIGNGANAVEELYLKADGNVGIGTGSPVNTLHIHDTGTDGIMQLTSSGTGATATDGLQIGSSSLGAWINYMENNGLSLGTNSLTRMYISSTGNVGINTSAGNCKLHVVSNEYLTSLATNSYQDGSASVATYLTATPPIAVKGIYNGSGANDGVGVFGGATSPSGGYGVGGVFTGKWYGAIIGGQTGGYSGLHVDANGATYALVVNGNLTGTGINNYSSDARLKKDIKPIDNALASIMSLKPSAYHFKVGEFGSMQLPEGLHYGVIAQELREVMPELVAENKFYGDSKEGMDYLAVNYIELIPIMVKGMQEQQALITAKDETINAQNAKLDELLKRVEKLEKVTK